MVGPNRHAKYWWDCATFEFEQLAQHGRNRLSHETIEGYRLSLNRALWQRWRDDSSLPYRRSLGNEGAWNGDSSAHLENGRRTKEIFRTTYYLADGVYSVQVINEPASLEARRGPETINPARTGRRIDSRAEGFACRSQFEHGPLLNCYLIRMRHRVMCSSSACLRLRRTESLKNLGRESVDDAASLKMKRCDERCIRLYSRHTNCLSTRGEAGKSWRQHMLRRCKRSGAIEKHRAARSVSASTTHGPHCDRDSSGNRDGRSPQRVGRSLFTSCGGHSLASTGQTPQVVGQATQA